MTQNFKTGDRVKCIEGFIDHGGGIGDNDLSIMVGEIYVVGEPHDVYDNMIAVNGTGWYADRFVLADDDDEAVPYQFKVGDLVKCVLGYDIQPFRLNVNEVYTIEEIHANCVVVNGQSWYASRFTLAPPTPTHRFKAGDVVKCIMGCFSLSNRYEYVVESVDLWYGEEMVKVDGHNYCSSRFTLVTTPPPPPQSEVVSEVKKPNQNHHFYIFAPNLSAGVLGHYFTFTDREEWEARIRELSDNNDAVFTAGTAQEAEITRTVKLEIKTKGE